MKVVGGIDKYTESEAHEIAEHRHLDFDYVGEIVRKCCKCGAYVDIEDYNTDEDSCLACLDGVSDDNEYEDYEE
mgnify:CR=1 FL=1